MSERRVLRRTVKLALPLVILLVAVAIAGYLRATRPGIETQPPEERAWPVAAVAVTVADEQPDIDVFGAIVAGREVELRPLVAGHVIEVGPNFVEGGVLSAGELVIAIDPFDYEAAVSEGEAELAEARAKLAEIRADLAAEGKLLSHDGEQVEISRREVERRETLRATAAGSEKALDDARMVLSEHEQRLISRQQTIDRHRTRISQQEAVIRRLEVALERARRNLQETRLSAPFDGFLTGVDGHVGKQVSVGDRVARLIDARSLEVRFHLSDSQFARLLAAGGYRSRPAKVIWRMGPEPFPFDAVIERIESEIEAVAGGINLYARILRTDAQVPLRPGAFVEVQIPGRVYHDAIRLPEQAVYDQDTVYKVVDGRLAAVKVEILVRDQGDVLVRGELDPGDLVVTTDFAEIGPGVRVMVR